MQRACVAAVQRVAVYYALLGRQVSSTNTGAYCRARAKVTEGVVQRLVEGVRQELWTGLLAYNLIRQSILQSALASARQPHELSFAASLQMLANPGAPGLAAVPPLVSVSVRERLVALRILNGHSHRVANRPNRVEPRAVKRRPSPLALLTELRSAARARLIANQKT